MYKTGYISKIIDGMPLGNYHKKLLGIAGAGFVFTSMEVFVIAFTLPLLISAWSLDPAATGFLGSASLLGMLVGSYLWGYISDRFGRKASFQYTILFYSVFTAASAFAPSYPALYALRFLTGIGLGGCLTVDTALLSENIPSRHRGRYLVLLDAFWPFGQIIATVLAYLILPDWRLLFVISAFPALFVAVLRSTIHETPYFLAKHGRMEELKSTLSKIAKENGTDADFSLPAKPEKESESQKTSYLELLSPKFRKDSVAIALVWISLNFGYYGLFIWLPAIFYQLGYASLELYTYILITALVQFPGYFSAAYLVDKIGRKKTLLAYLLLSGISALSFTLVSDNASLLITVSLVSFFCLGAWGTVYAYTPELFPTHIRATGMGWADGTGKIAAIFAPSIAGIVMAQYSLVAALALLGGSFVFGAVSLFFLGRETMGEKFE